MFSTFYNINELSGSVNEECYAALTKVCKNGDLSLVKFIVKELCAVVISYESECGELGYAAFHYASLNDNLEMVKYLVEECHVSVDEKDNGVYTALQLSKGKVKAYLKSKVYLKHFTFSEVGKK